MFWKIKKLLLAVLHIGIAASIKESPNAGVILDMNKALHVSSEFWIVIFMLCALAMVIGVIVNSYVNLVFYVPLFIYAGLQISRSVAINGQLTAGTVILATYPVNILVDFVGEYIAWQKLKKTRFSSEH